MNNKYDNIVDAKFQIDTFKSVNSYIITYIYISINFSPDPKQGAVC